MRSFRAQDMHLRLRIHSLYRAMICAAIKYVGKSKSGKKTKLWLTQPREVPSNSAIFSILSIFNESFSKGVVTGTWVEATILPLKKAASRRGLSPTIGLSASHPVLSRQWRECCTTACATLLKPSVTASHQTARPRSR